MGALTRLSVLASRPVDIASLAMFRIVFGGLMVFATGRFIWNGWVERFFIKPQFFFHYWGFEWVKPLSASGMYALFGVMAACGLLVSVGLFYRAAIITFFMCFSYVELIDVSNYLNHYYLVSLLSLLMCFLPLNRAWSLDALLRPGLRRDQVAAWNVWLLRFQVGVVYFFAGVAKLNSDWILYGQPLNVWLTARVETGLVGWVFGFWWAGLVMGWMGCLNDLLMPFLLSWRKTRLGAYGVVVGFHTVTGILFNIGMFPLIMVVSALVFFGEDWPRRLWAKMTKFVGARGQTQDKAPQAAISDAVFANTTQHKTPRWILATLCVYALLQVAVPLRCFLYPGNILWNEEGMRWAWRVMLREKNGSVTYLVSWDEEPGRRREVLVSPRRYTTDDQEREMSGQPDLILQLGHHIGREFASKGFGRVEVRVDAWVSLNGRPAQRMIDPKVDLMTIKDGLAPASWILPAPQTPPIRLQVQYAKGE